MSVQTDRARELWRDWQNAIDAGNVIRGEQIEAYLYPALLDAIPEWMEIERAAAGVVRTAHKGEVPKTVVPDWWNALRAALEGK